MDTHISYGGHPHRFNVGNRIKILTHLKSLCLLHRFLCSFLLCRLQPYVIINTYFNNYYIFYMECVDINKTNLLYVGNVHTARCPKDFKYEWRAGVHAYNSSREIHSEFYTILSKIPKQNNKKEVLCKCYQHLRDCMNRYVDINKAISVNLSRPGCHGSWMTEAAGP